MSLGYWTDERVHTLGILWAGGDAASVIATQMGTTRNAILGKVHRLELTPRAFSPALSPNPKLAHPRSVFNSREFKPRVRSERKPPKIITVFSPLTGAIVNRHARKSAPVEYTKSQLRAMLTQAVINTAGM